MIVDGQPPPIPAGDQMTAIMRQRKAFGHVARRFRSRGFADPKCGLAFSDTMNQDGRRALSRHIDLWPEA